MPFTTFDLRRIRSAHLLRLQSARRVDSRTGDPIGAPGTLVSLGAFLFRHDAVDGMSEAEHAFGLSLDHYEELAAEPCILDEGQRFAAVILDDIRAGGDGLRVRCPVRAVERPQMPDRAGDPLRRPPHRLRHAGQLVSARH